MSKLASALQLSRSRYQVPLMEPFSAVSVHESWTPTAGIGSEYRISTELRYSGFLSDAELSQSDEAALVLTERAKLAIIEEVFGEFRAHFIAVKRALDMHDQRQAMQRLAVFESVMFGVD